MPHRRGQCRSSTEGQRTRFHPLPYFYSNRQMSVRDSGPGHLLSTHGYPPGCGPWTRSSQMYKKMARCPMWMRSQSRPPRGAVGKTQFSLPSEFSFLQEFHS